MQPLYSLNRAVVLKLEPQVFLTKRKKIDGIFDFPVDNAIATNMLPGTNAVIMLTFNGTKIRYKTVAKNFKDYVGGGHTVYLPVFSEDIIGYSQNRGFTLLDIKKKKCDYYSIVGDFNYVILDIVIVDAGKRLFLFVIEIVNSDKSEQLLRLMDLGTNHSRLVSETIVGGDIGVACFSKVLFFYGNNGIYATDMNFREVYHPLVQVFNREDQISGGVMELEFHPYLPIVIIDESFSDDKNSTWAIFWNKENNKSSKNRMVKLLKGDCAFFKFSYDGKWVQFQDMENFYIMRVDLKLPNIFGRPILLGKVPDFPSGWGTTAMTRNPDGLVVTGTDDYGESFWLKKWDFSEAEKMIEMNR